MGDASDCTGKMVYNSCKDWTGDHVNIGAIVTIRTFRGAITTILSTLIAVIHSLSTHYPLCFGCA